ncbi:hypothetical protein DCAR_0310422 [Daucus carota subsp. sativus]|uniref:Uncharacterized protein n=1 Tax=Daucus carota subsp. sativus TaxID=79200 RepID=A0AAF0WK72_DAUCS|nr:hypothetical protein DCAR_0310422 [Daucus carota subsp. sativus]
MYVIVIWYHATAIATVPTTMFASHYSARTSQSETHHYKVQNKKDKKDAQIPKGHRKGQLIHQTDNHAGEQLNIQKEESKKKEVHVEDNLCINPLKETELILYGGEFYNGNKTYVYGDLYRYDVDKNEWKLISSPNSPPPRSAHQAVAWKNYLYIYGGEFTSPNQERFHHYKDFWMLDLKTNQWEQLNYKGCPSPRSGHQMVRFYVLCLPEYSLQAQIMNFFPTWLYVRNVDRILLI